MSIKKVIAPVVLLAFGNAALAMEWTDVKANSLSWPIAGTSVKNAVILFDHNDSAGLSNSKTNAPKHLGVDIAAPENAVVTAIDDGVVVKTGVFVTRSSKYTHEYYAIVESGKNKKWTTLYGHLKYEDLIQDPEAKTQKTVSRGQKIGKLVNQNEYGDIPHLHLGIRNLPNDHPLAVKGFIGPSDPSYPTYLKNKLNFVNPLDYINHKFYTYVDDASASKSGTWANKTDDYFYLGSGFAKSSGAKATASFKAGIDCGGLVKVYTRWPLNAGNTTSAVADIYLGAAFIGSKTINQTKGFYDMAANVNGPASGSTSSWFYLGDVSVGSKCTQIEVRLKNNDATKSLVADAILIEKQ